MHRFIGILGMLTMMGLAYAFSTNRRAIRYKTVAWGLGPADRFRVSGDALGIRAAASSKNWAPGANWLLDFAYYGSVIRLRRSRPEEFAAGLLFRLPGAADDHLHRRAFRGALLPRESCRSS